MRTVNPTFSFELKGIVGVTGVAGATGGMGDIGEAVTVVEVWETVGDSLPLVGLFILPVLPSRVMLVLEPVRRSGESLGSSSLKSSTSSCLEYYFSANS